MNNSDRDPDAIDRIRDDALTEQKPQWYGYVSPDVIGAGMNARLQEQAARIASLESELKTMTSAADDRIREDASVLGRTCGYCNFTGDMMAYAQHVCLRDVMQSEIDSLRAQLAAATEWKDDAILVLSTWEEVFNAAGRPGELGRSKAEIMKEWVAAATERERKLCDAARQVRHVLIEAEFPDDRWMVTLLTDALAAAQQEGTK